MKWGGKDLPGGSSYSYSTVPILVGAKYYLVPMVPFYAMANLGLTIISWSYDSPSITVPYYGTVGGGSTSFSSSEFTFAIGGGYEIPLTPSITLDVSAAFNIISNSNYLGVKAGVLFPL
jgi:opacity protein-like surface antigen